MQNATGNGSFFPIGPCTDPPFSPRAWTQPPRLQPVDVSEPPNERLSTTNRAVPEHHAVTIQKNPVLGVYAPITPHNVPGRAPEEARKRAFSCNDSLTELPQRSE